MVSGAFKRFRHEHLFKTHQDGNLMTDLFDYTVPLGIFGKWADQTFLQFYMERLLLTRNECIKAIAEKEPLFFLEK